MATYGDIGNDQVVVCTTNGCASTYKGWANGHLFHYKPLGDFVQDGVAMAPWPPPESSEQPLESVFGNISTFPLHAYTRGIRDLLDPPDNTH